MDEARLAPAAAAFSFNNAGEDGSQPVRMKLPRIEIPTIRNWSRHGRSVKLADEEESSGPVSAEPDATRGEFSELLSGVRASIPPADWRGVPACCELPLSIEG